MKIKEKVLSIIAGIGAFFSALFYVLFIQAKDQKKQTELKLENAEKEISDLAEEINESQKQKKIIEKSREKGIEKQKQNEEIYKNATSGNNRNSLDAIIDGLSK